MLCMFLGGVGIVGVVPIQDVKLDLQACFRPSGSYREKECDLNVQDAKSKSRG